MKTLNTEELEISLYHQNDNAVVSVQGEVDLSTVTTLQEALEKCASQLPEGSRLVVDLRQVGFIDSAGLALLVKIWKQFETRWQLTLIIAPSSQPERVLKLGRFDHFFRVIHTPEEL